MPINRVGAAGIGSCTVAAQDIEDATLTNANFGPGSISNAQLANSSITVNGTSASLGGTLTLKEEINWQAVQVADGSTQVVATAGNGYFLDTNAGVIEVFLPSSPTRGDVVAVVDYAGTFATNQCIVNTGGVNIDSTVGSEFKLTTNETIAYFVYVDSNKGWMVYLNQAAGTTPSGITTSGGFYDGGLISATGGTITTSSDYKIHTFTGDGCFTVLSGGGPLATVDYLVVAGGGAGGANIGGGGGAGGYRESYNPCTSGCLFSKSFSYTNKFISFNSNLSNYSWSWWYSNSWTRSSTSRWIRIKFNFFNNHISRWRRRWKSSKCFSNSWW
jgi:hypothetical protein